MKQPPISYRIKEIGVKKGKKIKDINKQVIMDVRGEQAKRSGKILGDRPCDQRTTPVQIYRKRARSTNEQQR